MNDNYNINDNFSETLNEAGLGSWFKGVLGVIAGLITAGTHKVLKKIIETGKSEYLKRYLDSVEEQVKKGTKSKHPDGFDKIIATADKELINDFDNYTKVFTDIKSDIENSVDINPSNIRLLNNAQETFKKKYIDNIRKLMDSIVKQYDTQINNAIDKFNETYNKNSGMNKKLNGDKIKKVWESYRNKIEQIEEEYIQNFEQTENFKKLYNLIFGEMNRTKKELEYAMNNKKSPLSLGKIHVEARDYDISDLSKLLDKIKVTVRYSLHTKLDIKQNMNIFDGYLITTLDKNKFDEIAESLDNINFRNFGDLIDNLKKESGVNVISKGSNPLKIEFLNITGNRNTFDISYFTGGILTKDFPLLTRFPDDAALKGEGVANSLYVVSFLLLAKDAPQLFFKAAQEYTNSNKGTLSITVN